MMEDFSPPESPDDQNTNDPQQINPDIPPQTPKESALQKSDQEVARPAKSNKLSYKQIREEGRQQMNKNIAKYAKSAQQIGKKTRSRGKCQGTFRDLEAGNAQITR